MGHLTSKEVYHNLGEKLAGIGTHIKAVNNEKFQKILQSLFLPDEASLVWMMPYGLSNFSTLVQVTKTPSEKLIHLLERASDKGLIVDIIGSREVLYAPSPFVIGFFEFTMMRKGSDLPTEAWAKLFHDYFSSGEIYHANYSNKESIGIGRALPYEEFVEGVTPETSTEILDYESAVALIERTSFVAVGTCACRHEAHHLGTRKCSHALETCLSMGSSAMYLSKHGFANQISKEKARELLLISKESGLVLTADNVKRDVSFICQCCSCCCNILQGFNKFGYTSVITSSNYEAFVQPESCRGCNACVKACPVSAISTVRNAASKNNATIDLSRCIGCGVCASKCSFRAITLKKRKKLVFHPEDIIERAFLSNLERGTLQNFIFNNPHAKSSIFVKYLVRLLLKNNLVKKTIASERIRSRFLEIARRQM